MELSIASYTFGLHCAVTFDRWLLRGALSACVHLGACASCTCRSGNTSCSMQLCDRNTGLGSIKRALGMRDVKIVESKTLNLDRAACTWAVRHSASFFLLQRFPNQCAVHHTG